MACSVKFWALTISKAQKRINSTTGFRWWILTQIAPVGLLPTSLLKKNNPISAEIGLKFWALTISKAQKRINSTTGFRWWILTPIAPVGLQLDCCRRLYLKKNNPISAEIGLKFWALTISKAQKWINSTAVFRGGDLDQFLPKLDENQ